MKKKAILITAVLLVAGLLFTGCDLIETNAEPAPQPTPVEDPGVTAEANLVPVDHINLHFAMAGEVGAILVEEGDQVEAGDILARLVNVEGLEAQVLAAEQAVLDAEQRLDELNDMAELVAAQAEVALVEARQALVEAERAYDEVDTDEFRQDLDDARVDMIEARDDLEDAEETLADHSDLDEDHFLRQRYEDDVERAQQDYDEARWAFEELENEYDLARKRLDEARSALNDVEREVEATRDGQVDPDDLALAESNLESAQGQLRAAERALDDVELTAPFDGRIVRVELTEGAYTTPEQLGFVLADISAWHLETTDLTEIDVVEVEVGDVVEITFDALPDLIFIGDVESISEYYLERFGDITYEVRIRLRESDDRLRWGMTAEVSFSD